MSKYTHDICGRLTHTKYITPVCIPELIAKMDEYECVHGPSRNIVADSNMP